MVDASAHQCRGGIGAQDGSPAGEAHAHASDRDGSSAVDPHYPREVIYQGYTVLITDRGGAFQGQGRTGLFDYDTRILSRHQIRLDGQAPEYVSSGLPTSDRWEGRLRLPRPGGDAAGPVLPQDAVEFFLRRRIGCGMEEQIIIRNHSMVPLETELALELDADFADAQEIGGERQQSGEVRTSWDDAQRALRFEYRVEHAANELERALRVSVLYSDSPAAYTAGALRFHLRLPPRGEWRAGLSYASLVDGEWREPLPAVPDGETVRERGRAQWRAVRARVETQPGAVGAAFERAAEDLFSLRAWEYDEAPDAWFPMAGVPSYTGIFGRDSLTAAWQGALIGPEIMHGALAVIARTQATEDSAWRDEEPGKMVHEIRRGPLSELDIIPQRAYYGGETSPAMFVLALSEAWHWTGDESLLRRYRDAALETFAWAERYGDPDGDGLLEYNRRSPKGLKNQAWKDSDEAIRYPDGTIVPDPIATIEEQAYHFIALQRMAEILLALGEDTAAEHFLARARAHERRIQEAFWIEEDGFYAMALDPQKRPVRSIGSNSGHALAAGVVPIDRARRIADRMLAPDLFSGWGIRTLSTAHPSYNPWAYHLGTVWPVENATFALGMKRYGLDEHAERLTRAMLDAAAGFHAGRLPEALSGHSRDESPIPCAYPNANSPQAWSASATMQFIQVLLGLYPFAPAHALALVRPRLPYGVDALTLRNLRVGDATVSIRFDRSADGTTRHEVISKRGTLHVLTVPPPQDVASQDESAIDQVKRWLVDHAPGRMASALRVAMGDLVL